MKLNDLAYKLYEAHIRHENIPSAPWLALKPDFQDYWRGIAMHAADALGVKLDPANDPRYAAARGVLNSIWSETAQDTLARAIVAALDAADADRGTA